MLSPAVAVGSSDAPASGADAALDLVETLGGATSGLERFFCCTVAETVST